MARPLSKPQRRALQWLDDRGGTAILNRYGRAMAMGEAAPFEASTWLRLMILGHIAPAPLEYFELTAKGREAIA